MKKETVVLFTSCDANLLKHVPTLLMSVHEFMSGYSVEFYFLHVDLPQEQMEKLRRFCDRIHIRFQAIAISGRDLEQYREIKMLCSAESSYPVEGYFDILPNLHLPQHVDRALYLDAGDVILAGDISPFYFSEFNGNILTVAKGFAERWDYSAKDLYERQSYLQIAIEYFNAGVVLLNVALMRQLNIGFEHYRSIVKQMGNVHGVFQNVEFGRGHHYVVQDEQGLLAIAFVGYINFYDPDHSGNANTPYNFRPFVIEHNQAGIPNAAQLSLENLRPKILHLLGNKPWTPHEKRKTLLPISQQCLALWDSLEAKAKSIDRKRFLLFPDFDAPSPLWKRIFGEYCEKCREGIATEQLFVYLPENQDTDRHLGELTDFMSEHYDGSGDIYIQVGQIADEGELFAVADCFVATSVEEAARYTHLADQFGVQVLSGADISNSPS